MNPQIMPLEEGKPNTLPTDALKSEEQVAEPYRLIFFAFQGFCRLLPRWYDSRAQMSTFLYSVCCNI